MKKLYTKKSHITGNGLYASVPFKRGDRISYIHGPIHVIRQSNPQQDKKTLDWIGVGRFSWIDTTHSIFRYINHSCEPNVYILGKRTVVALKDIAPNTEIVMDYSLSEADKTWSIACLCKSKECRGTVRSIGYLPKKIFSKYNPYISKNFKSVYRVETGIQ